MTVRFVSWSGEPRDGDAGLAQVQGTYPDGHVEDFLVEAPNKAYAVAQVAVLLEEREREGSVANVQAHV